MAPGRNEQAARRADLERLVATEREGRARVEAAREAAAALLDEARREVAALEAALDGQLLRDTDGRIEALEDEAAAEVEAIEAEARRRAEGYAATDAAQVGAWARQVVSWIVRGDDP